MSVCSVHDFQIFDLYKPVGKRLMNQMSAVINFIKFREDKIRGISEYTSVIVSGPLCAHVGGHF